MLLRVFPLLLVSLVLLVAAAPLAAQTGALEGTVRDDAGKPIAGAQIVIVRQDMRGRWETKTDKKGNYVYMGLPAGRQPRYRLEVYREGELIYQMTDIQVEMDAYRRVDIDLAQIRKKQQEEMTEEQKRELEEFKKRQEKQKALEDQFGQGVELLNQGQFAEAATMLEAAAATDPTQFAVWIRLGDAYKGLNNVDKAIEAYEKAIALKPDEPGIHNNVGTLYARRGRVADAQQAFEKAASLDPPKAGMYYFNLGATLVNAGRMKEAVAPLQKAIELEPNRAAAHYWLGVCLYAGAESKIEGGQVKTVLLPGTVEAFEKYLELEPNGQYAADAKANLEAIAVQVPAAISTKKKKR